MKREDWQSAYEPIPAALSVRVSAALSQLDKEEKVMKRALIRSLALALCAAMLLCCTALALINSDIISYLSGYNAELSEDQQKLLKSDFEQQSLLLGDVQVNLKEIITDGYICAIALEYRAPDGIYLYSDLANLSIEALDMSRSDFLKAYSAYYELSEAVYFLSQDGSSRKISEGMRDWRQPAPNVMQEQIILATVDCDLSQMQIELEANRITQPEPDTDKRFSGVFTPDCAADQSGEQKFSLAFSVGTGSPGIAQVDVTFAKLVTLFSAQVDNAGDSVYSIRVFDAEGKELGYTILSSIISTYQEGVILKSYDAMAEVPETLSVQLYLLTDSGEQPVGESITLSLHK